MVAVPSSIPCQDLEYKPENSYALILTSCGHVGVVGVWNAVCHKIQIQKTSTWRRLCRRQDSLTSTSGFAYLEETSGFDSNVDVDAKLMRNSGLVA